MNFKIKKKEGLNGELVIPGDKSISHRSIMCASLAEGESEIIGFLEGEDCLATMEAFAKMGVNLKKKENKIIVKGVGLHGLNQPKEDLYLGNSGTSMRLLSGLLAGQNFSSKLTGDNSLSSRPMLRIVNPLTQMGVDISCNKNGMPPLFIDSSNEINGIKYVLPVASAQVKSCLMFAALYANEESEIIENEQTRDHSERMFKKFGIQILEESSGNKKIIKIKPATKLNATTLNIPGDFSSAAFFILAATINPDSELTLKNVGLNPTRTALLTVLMEMGANIEIKNSRDDYEPSADILVKSSRLNGIDLDEKLISNLIDELPVLFIAAAFANGSTKIRGAEELRTKESDRLEAMSKSLSALGVNYDLFEDGIDIKGSSNFNKSVKINSFGDHRIAMASAVACSMIDGDNIIENVNNVSTSFPNFVQISNSIGMDIDHI